MYWGVPGGDQLSGIAESQHPFDLLGGAQRDGKPPVEPRLVPVHFAQRQ
jgi:hypothetical protein